MRLLKLPLLLFSILILGACTKEETPTPVVITPPPIPPAPQKTKAQLLSSHPWKYDLLIHNSHSTPDTVYKRGSASNTLNLDGDVYTYAINGSFNAVLSSVSSVVVGRWNLWPDDSMIEVRDQNGALVSTAQIIKIDASNYIFMYADMDSYGKLIPQ